MLVCPRRNPDVVFDRKLNFTTAIIKKMGVFYTGRFIMFSVITNIYNKKTKGPTLVELFTATGKLKNCNDPCL
jgi:hypothetical protein